VHPDDPLHGLDPEEVADLERRLAAEASGRPDPARRRTVLFLVTFVIVVLPVILGTIGLAERFVYRSLCARNGPVADVVIDLPVDGGLTTATSDGRPTCIHEDGVRIAMQDVVGKSKAIALDWAVSIVAFGSPLAITIALWWQRSSPDAAGLRNRD